MVDDLDNKKMELKAEALEVCKKKCINVNSGLKW